MGREDFSAPEESKREKRRKSVLQVQYSLLGAFLGALIGTAPLTIHVIAGVAVLFALLPILTNRYWEPIHSKLP